MKFKDIVVNLVSGAMPSNRVGYYIKRFSQEASVRRLASVLLIGLFIFQSLVFIFPPKASVASDGGNDLIKGGIGVGEIDMKKNLKTNVSANTYTAAFFQLMGVNSSYVDSMVYEEQLNPNDWSYSMGHNAFGGAGCSTRFDQIPEFGGNAPFPGSETVYVGSPNCRWSNNYSPAGLVGTRPVNIGGTWWNLAIIGDCGNILLKPTAPPPPPPSEEPPELPLCDNLNASRTSVLPGEQIAFTGRSISRNYPGLTQASMAYGVYDYNTLPDLDLDTVNRPTSTGVDDGNGDGYYVADGIPINNDGSFTNDYRVTFKRPGRYIVRMLAASNQLDSLRGIIWPNSLVGGCSKIIEVLREDIWCNNIAVNSENQPIIRVRGSAMGSNFPSNQTVNMQYNLYRKGQASPIDSRDIVGIPYDGSVGAFRDNYDSNNPNAARLREFNINQPGEYEFSLRVTYTNSDNSPVLARWSEEGNCRRSYTYGPSLRCNNLVINPQDGPYINADIRTRGSAESNNMPSGTNVKMEYRAYTSGSNQQIGSTIVVDNVPRGVDTPENFYRDVDARIFRFNSAGNYDIKLKVFYRLPGSSTEILAEGSESGDCSKTIQIVQQAQPAVWCNAVVVNPASASINQEVRTRGTARSKDVSADQKVKMEYRAYRAGSNQPVSDPIIVNNVPKGVDTEFPDVFRDTEARIFKLTEPGQYEIRLKVLYTLPGSAEQVASGSEVEGCAELLTIVAPDKLSCKAVNLNPSNPDGSTSPVTVSFRGEASDQSGNAYVAKYNYKVFKVENGNENKLAEFTSEFPASAKSISDSINPAKSFNFTSQGTYRIKLSIIPTVNIQVTGNEAGDCLKEFEVIPPQSFECKSLVATPVSGRAPLDVNFVASAKAEGVRITEYSFDFGDGTQVQSIVSDKNTISTDHTYTKPGEYTARFNFKTNAGEADGRNINCRVEIEATDIQFVKIVANTTQLINGQPIDANNVTARGGDVLRYQIGICNDSTSAIGGYIFKDNISDLLYYTDLVDTGGGTVKTDTGTTVLEWPAIDVPPLENGQKCVDDEGKIIPENFKTFKEFTVKVKDPVPTTGTKQADPDGYDCKVTDEFEGNIVTTPINCSIPKIIETNNPLPRTGAGWALGIIGFFAASSIFLFFRNRMLKRELELASTLTEGMYGQS